MTHSIKDNIGDIMDPDPYQGLGHKPAKVEGIIPSCIDLPVIVIRGPLPVRIIKWRVGKVCSP